ncbi:MAG: hypothetical protein JEZ08_13395 [Clostridiales bacterium]|nr:hypothetical protein [Clostridiales bacterium]
MISKYPRVKKGWPYDNAVAEALFKTFRKEFVNPNALESLGQLKLELFDYLKWITIRDYIHHWDIYHQVHTKFYTLRKLSNKMLTFHSSY